tara:strand:+ start:7715 stop:8203 length:489 start_codon:yes stop_codon:yes gene_type:complete
MCFSPHTPTEHPRYTPRHTPRQELGAGPGGLLQEMALCEKGDFHVWVEDASGNVVHDPHFWQYDAIKETHGCDPDEPKQYRRFHNQKECRDLVMKKAIRNACMYENMISQGMTFLGEDRFGFCPINAHYFMRRPENKGKGYKVVVGAMGWKKGNGEVWWEYG